MRPPSTRINLNQEKRFIVDGEKIYIRDQSWSNRVSNQVAEPFLLVKGISNTGDGMRTIRNPDNNPAPCGVGKSDDGLYDIFGRRQISLELKRFSFRLADEF